MNAMKHTVTYEAMAMVSGGTQEEADRFLALAEKKGWGGPGGPDQRMAAAKMYKTIGMTTVNWHITTNDPAEFFDAQGRAYSFDEILSLLEALPDRN